MADRWSTDGAEYRRCQARHGAAVGAYDALAAAFDELLQRLGARGEKK